MPILIPESERLVFKKNFLKTVVCQVIVQPILKISQEPPATFQERLRKTYPILESEEGVQFVFGAGKEPVKSEVVGRQWFLKTEDGRWSITLNPNFLALATTNYEHFSAFSERFKEILNAYNEVYAPSKTERIGFRYVNHIVPNENIVNLVKWQEWVRPELTGFITSSMVEFPILRAASEIRTVQNPGEMTIRHGLIPEGTTGQLMYLLDTDRYYMGRIELSKTIEYLDKFNKDCYNFFRWAIGKKAYEYLEPKNE